MRGLTEVRLAEAVASKIQDVALDRLREGRGVEGVEKRQGARGREERKEGGGLRLHYPVVGGTGIETHRQRQMARKQRRRATCTRPGYSLKPRPRHHRKPVLAGPSPHHFRVTGRVL